jgi:predicted amidohydrolase
VYKRQLQTYDKLWADVRFTTCPGPFLIDGVPCCAAICADRWARGVEELPAARILFECSNNYANEWLPDLGWYWCAPRAVRNQAFVVFANTPRENRAEGKPGHGHSAVIAPDGRVLVAAGEESDRLLVATLDLAEATRGRAAERRAHPLLRPFWDAGATLLGGGSVPAPAVEPLRSPKVPVTIAAAQIPCSRTVADNVARMTAMIRAAQAKGADVVAFPELAVTGTRADDIERTDGATLQAALDELRAAAKAAGVAVAFGMPFRDGGRLYNGAYVLGPDGAVLTRYGQVAADRSGPFAPGTSTKAMWFRIRGVPAVVTVGRDGLWSEIAELAAVRGAQVHLHLANGRDGRPPFRQQVWANLASFRTFTATVNAAAPADGGSALWEDFRRTKAGPEGGFFPHSAVRLAEAGAGEELLTATQTVFETNAHLDRLTRTTYPQMRAWYLTGAKAIAAEVPAAAGREGGVCSDASGQ